MATGNDQRAVEEAWLISRFFLNILEVLEAHEAMPRVRAMCDSGQSAEAHRLVFDAIESEAPTTLEITPAGRKKLSRRWKLLEEPARGLVKTVLPRMDLTAEEMRRILSPSAAANGFSVEKEDMLSNPYVLCEQYVGDSADDVIPWSTVDRAIFPSPELGGKPLSDMEYDDARRFRALCVVLEVRTVPLIPAQ